MKKNTVKDIPSVSSLRKSYIDECYEDTMNEIRKHLMVKKILVPVDETTDATGRYILFQNHPRHFSRSWATIGHQKKFLFFFQKTMN